MSNIDNERTERENYYPLWLWLGEVLLEPFVLAFSVFMLFTRILHLIEAATNFSVFLEMFDEDMVNNMFVYIFFGVIITTWIIFRAKKVSLEFKREKAELQLHSQMLTTIEQLRQDLKPALKEALKECREEPNNGRE